MGSGMTLHSHATYTKIMPSHSAVWPFQTIGLTQLFNALFNLWKDQEVPSSARRMQQNHWRIQVRAAAVHLP